VLAFALLCALLFFVISSFDECHGNDSHNEVCTVVHCCSCHIPAVFSMESTGHYARDQFAYLLPVNVIDLSRAVSDTPFEPPRA